MFMLSANMRTKQILLQFYIHVVAGESLRLRLSNYFVRSQIDFGKKNFWTITQCIKFTSCTLNMTLFLFFDLLLTNCIDPTGKIPNFDKNQSYVMTSLIFVFSFKTARNRQWQPINCFEEKKWLNHESNQPWQCLLPFMTRRIPVQRTRVYIINYLCYVHTTLIDDSFYSQTCCVSTKRYSIYYHFEFFSVKELLQPVLDRSYSCFCFHLRPTFFLNQYFTYKTNFSIFLNNKSTYVIF